MSYSSFRSKKSAFTLIEVMIVIAIIGILTATVMVSLQAFRLKSEATKALTDLQRIQLYLETYKANNGVYPLSCGSGTQWAARTAYSGWCGLGDCWISEFSGEGWCPLPYNIYPPQPGRAVNESQYIYRTNVAGTEYKLIYHWPVSMAVPGEFIDPRRPDWSFGVWSPGGAGI